MLNRLFTILTKNTTPNKQDKPNRTIIDVNNGQVVASDETLDSVSSKQTETQNEQNTTTEIMKTDHHDDVAANTQDESSETTETTEFRLSDDENIEIDVSEEMVNEPEQPETSETTETSISDDDEGDIEIDISEEVVEVVNESDEISLSDDDGEIEIDVSEEILNEPEQPEISETTEFRLSDDESIEIDVSEEIVEEIVNEPAQPETSETTEISLSDDNDNGEIEIDVPEEMVNEPTLPEISQAVDGLDNDDGHMETDVSETSITHTSSGEDHQAQGCTPIITETGEIDFCGLMLEQTITAHRDWLQTLREVLAGKMPESYSPDVVGDENVCELGKWLNSDGKSLNKYDEYMVLLETHRHFHTCAAEVVRLHQKEEFAAAIMMLRHDLQNLSEEVEDSLKHLHQQVQAAKFQNNDEETSSE